VCVGTTPATLKLVPRGFPAKPFRAAVALLIDRNTQPVAGS
jgi:hypothetical protein